jgi:hypothetical protein
MTAAHRNEALSSEQTAFFFPPSLESVKNQGKKLRKLLGKEALHLSNAYDLSARIFGYQTIAVWKGMNPHQLAVKSCGNLVGRECAVVDPPPRVIEKVSQFDADLRPVTSDVFVGLAERACPRPGLVEHFLVKVATELFTKDIGLALTSSPLHGLEDVRLLPVIQVALGGQVRRYQPCELVRVERCLAVLFV